MTNKAPDQSSQIPRMMPAHKLLSCTSCRQRKIKCNKASPCTPCFELGCECIYPIRRVRTPRAKRDGIRARDEELLARIRHLESMLTTTADLDLEAIDGRVPLNASKLALDFQHSQKNKPAGSTETRMTIDDHYSTFIKQQGSSSRHLNHDFWSNLSNEFNGLRQLLEGPIDDEDDSGEGEASATDTSHFSPDFIMQDPDNFSYVDIQHPPNAHSVVLFQFYFKNVAPVCKVLHRPTVTAYFSNLKALFDPATRRFKFRSLEAVTFAVYFAAVVSMSTEECVDYFGEERETLSARYKRYTELALMQADFMNSLEITTLQGFTIYLVSVLQACTFSLLCCRSFPNWDVKYKMSDEIVCKLENIHGTR